MQCFLGKCSFSNTSIVWFVKEVFPWKHCISMVLCFPNTTSVVSQSEILPKKICTTILMRFINKGSLKRAKNICFCSSFLKALSTLYLIRGASNAPLSQISSCALGIDFWGALKWWQFISVHILLGYFPSRAKNYLGKVLEHHFWGKGHFSR